MVCLKHSNETQGRHSPFLWMVCPTRCPMRMLTIVIWSRFDCQADEGLWFFRSSCLIRHVFSVLKHGGNPLCTKVMSLSDANVPCASFVEECQFIRIRRKLLLSAMFLWAWCHISEVVDDAGLEHVKQLLRQLE